MGALLSLSGTALAFGDQWYLGVGGGTARLQPDPEDDNIGLDDEYGSSAQLYLGRDFDNRSSGQFTLYSLGDATFDNQQTATYLAGDASLLYRFFDSRDRSLRRPVVGASIYGRFGFGFIDRDSDISLENDTPVYFGAGAGVEAYFTHNLGMRLEALYHETDTASLTLSLVSRFGGIQRPRRRPPARPAQPSSTPSAEVTPEVNPEVTTAAVQKPAATPIPQQLPETYQFDNRTPASPNPTISADSQTPPTTETPSRPESRANSTELPQSLPTVPTQSIPGLADSNRLQQPNAQDLPSAGVGSNSRSDQPTTLEDSINEGVAELDDVIEPVAVDNDAGLNAPTLAGQDNAIDVEIMADSTENLVDPLVATAPSDTPEPSVEPLASVVPAPVPAPVPATDSAPELVDTDRDSVPDNRDNCAQSTFGYPVDNQGCPVFNGHMREVVFNAGSADLLPSAFPPLDQMAKLLQQYPEVRLELVAHTDNTGTVQEQSDRTRQRLRTLGMYLISKGISAKRLVLRSYGGSRPAHSNDTAPGRRSNNRIEVFENP